MTAPLSGQQFNHKPVAVTPYSSKHEPLFAQQDINGPNHKVVDGMTAALDTTHERKAYRWDDNASGFQRATAHHWRVVTLNSHGQPDQDHGFWRDREQVH